MTIVAYYKDTLFADSMSVIPTDTHQQISFRDKLHISPCRRIAYVKAGIIIQTEVQKELFGQLVGVFAENLPSNGLCFKADGYLMKSCMESSIVMLKDSTWRYNRDTEMFHRLGSEEIFSHGTGTSVFEMSLALGTTGEAAMKNAIQYAPLCGGPILTVKRSTLKPFKFIKDKKDVK